MATREIARPGRDIQVITWARVHQGNRTCNSSNSTWPNRMQFTSCVIVSHAVCNKSMQVQKYAIQF